MAKAKKSKWTVKSNIAGEVTVAGGYEMDITLEDADDYKREIKYLEAAAELLPRIKAAWKSKKEGEF